MNPIHKSMLQAYIYGYLNTYYVMLETMSLTRESYFEFRKAAFFSYIKRSYNPDSIFQSVVCSFISLFEVPVSIIIIFCQFLLALFKAILIRKKKVSKTVVVYDIGQTKLEKLLDDAGYNSKDVVLITPPERKQRKNYNCYSIFSIISPCSVFQSFILSMKTVLFMNKKYRKNELLFRSYSSFHFYLAFFCLKKLSVNNSFIFFSTYNRWAQLMGGVKAKKIFVQHGVIGEYPFLRKCGSVEMGIFISPYQELLCKEYLFNEVRGSAYQKSLKLNNEHLIRNGKINVLFVCHSKYRDLEDVYIHRLGSLQILNIYIKPHPLESCELYQRLASDINGIILSKSDFIEADYVIGYHSTLMEEYANINIPVHYYSDSDFDSFINSIIK